MFNTIEGGAIAHKSDALCDRLAQWRNFGITGPEDVEYVGGNSKMNEFAAAMGICNLRHVDAEIAKRRAVAERYWGNLESVPGLRFVKPAGNVRHNYCYLPVFVDAQVFGSTRDGMFDALERQGIGARKYFYPIVSDYACYRDRFDSSATPVAKRAGGGIVTLPMYADLALEDVDRICAIVRDCGR